ncbi:MAG: MTH1187 family thiamine-binding protein, partial [Patescibacteria group bacterium]
NFVQGRQLLANNMKKQIKKIVVAEISAFPIGEGESLSQSVAEAVKVIKESGLKYQIGAMGTAVEGEWGQIIKLFTKCRDKLIASHNRIYLMLKIDERKSPTHGIIHKIKAVEEKI